MDYVLGHLPSEVVADSDSGNALSFVDKALPNEADILVSYATVPGYVSYRHVEHGSFYVRALCNCIEDLSDQLVAISNLSMHNHEHSM